MLFKGATRSRLDDFFKPNGVLTFSALGGRGAGDFAKYGSGLYFTTIFDVAWQHAQWAQNLGDGNVVPVETLHVAVPKHLLASCRELDGDEWRRFVWANRRADEAIPSDLRHLTEFQWLIGPVCHSPNANIERMNSLAELETW